MCVVVSYLALAYHWYGYEFASNVAQPKRWQWRRRGVQLVERLVKNSGVHQSKNAQTVV